MNKAQEQLAEWRKLTQAELNTKLIDAKLKYQNLASQVAMGKLKTVSELKKAKKEIARMSTINNEKNILEEVSNG